MAKKGQIFNIYTEEPKWEVVRLKLEGAGLIKSVAKIAQGSRKFNMA